jgi:hydroxymethylpyrimidine/phosphomethylpyrimidine kinase
LRLAERRSRPILDALMNSDSTPAPDTQDANQEADPTASLEAPAPACVMCFNASDPSGAGGLPGDVATVAAMGAHALPVVTTIVMRDTAEVFDQHLLDAEIVAEQARSILEDVTVAGFKVGFLGSAEIVGAVAEVLSDYADVPLVSYLPGLSWLDEDQQQPYLDAFRELILPATEVLVGNHQTLMDCCCPTGTASARPRRANWRWPPASTAPAIVLVTGVMLPSKGPDQFIDNVLASPQGALTGEKFERFDTSFVGAATRWPRHWPRCWPPAANCRPPSARRWPSSTRAWTRVSAPAWAMWSRTASSGPCRRRRRRRRRASDPADSRRRPARGGQQDTKGGPRRVH